MNTTTNSEQIESKQTDSNDINKLELDKNFMDQFYDTCVKYYLLSGKKFS